MAGIRIGAIHSTTTTIVNIEGRNDDAAVHEIVAALLRRSSNETSAVASALDAQLTHRPGITPEAIANEVVDRVADDESAKRRIAATARQIATGAGSGVVSQGIILAARAIIGV